MEMEMPELGVIVDIWPRARPRPALEYRNAWALGPAQALPNIAASVRREDTDLIALK